MDEKTSMLNWHKIVAKYNKSNELQSWWQVISTLVLYVLVFYLAYRSLEISYWLTLGLSLIGAGLLVRLFILGHDCGHGSLFKKKKVNDIVGTSLFLLSFMPYRSWVNDHAYHHKTVGNLDKRGVGDVPTMTVEEYKKSNWLTRFAYRMVRNPWFLLFIASPFSFLVRNRYPSKHHGKNEKLSIYLTDISLVIIVAGLMYLIGWKEYILVQGPVMYFASIFGVFLFFVQHQFDGVVWERSGKWDYARIALKGSSVLKLPRILEWFSGSIGYHHIHHLSPKIPNYNLRPAHEQNALFQNVKTLTLGEAIKCFRFKLWDENRRRLVSFREALAG